MVISVPAGNSCVSNPPGWEGDADPLMNVVPNEAVSNPLGWEGDPGRRHEREVSDSVSNPLGWEGDLSPRGIVRFKT